MAHIHEDVEKKNLGQETWKRQKKLFDKKINAVTLEKLIQHQHDKIEPANKMIAEYYIRREQALQKAKIHREQANRGGIYNFRMSKYDNIFKIRQQDNRLKQVLQKKNGLILQEPDHRPVIDLFDQNNKEQEPTIITYDPIKGIYVMEKPPVKQIKISKDALPEESTLANPEGYNKMPRPRYVSTTTKKRNYGITKIDPSKRPIFLSEIKDYPDQLSEFSDEKEKGKILTADNLQSQKQKPLKFSKKQFLKQLEQNKQEQHLHLPNYYKSTYSFKQSFGDVVKIILKPLFFPKWSNKNKRWNK